MPKFRIFKTVKDKIRTRFTEKVNREAERVLEEEVNQICLDIKNHPVGKELSFHSNPSLLFKKPSGSLFGFMGFLNGRDPISELISYFKSGQAFKLNKIKPLGIRTGLDLKIIGPKDDDLVANGIVTDQWGDGRSWPEMIETGIPNLNRFLPKDGKGRSSEGVLIKRNLNEGISFKPVSFLSAIYKNSNRRFYYKLFKRLSK